jgi:hypothetical protein
MFIVVELLEIERRNSNVILRDGSQVDVKNVHDCNQLTLSHSIEDVDYNVLSFWYFYIGHLYIHDGDMFWSLLLAFVTNGKLLLVLYFFEAQKEILSYFHPHTLRLLFNLTTL